MNRSSSTFDIAIEQAFDFLCPEYAELFDNSAATAFQHPQWLHSLYARLASHAGATRLIVVVRHRTTRALAMVLPLLRIRRGPIRTVEFADLRVSDYLAPVCSPGAFSQLLADESACAELRSLLRPFDLLRMTKLPDGRLPIENLLAAPRRVSMDTNAYATVLIAPFEQWRASAMDRSYQKELAKKYRQLQKKGALSFSCCNDSASMLDALEVMKKFRGPRFQSQGDGDLLQRPEYFDFYSEVALRGLGSFVRLYAMKMDGEVIAAVLGLCHRDTFHVIMSAFDIAGYKSQSLGALMFEQVARDCIERGDQMLDFTIGDEPYKKLFGGQPSPMWAVTKAGSTAGAVALFALKQAPWLKLAAKRMSEFRLLPTRTSTPTR
ncbi:GNAT family N-acetyltransferase [Bradyrhizobium sp. 180]|uniref:GNAT family N-acetyltransferase n=1 Tax=unclassified Bradyrhizobium TaxID=2631580 RepID=UPI0029F890F3|nr:GNAT family N-acetyltransferase [Bradyrhizobium sp. CW12]MCK1494313.1 GNAT family N-acetyltransferase [Bradyrhizobium sp. 180]MCK1530488.1 GNAT family N-acetyltransferase [Bradyrhizobium sp. 182]MCK1594939.1 GNAT family N-acetyltransferase [Bradyrhizobium sp. 164]MCK1615695.1 GNAT family N-acetyltransferase [Bradyrhizobium sp. 159]MCK1645511.1 GNAT family N-acetyltransferase [Bradyrhizobium sp. 154]MCK1663963.1 GNAT family N-acetyltransferase [Bradyrhizobium sp. 153]